MEVANQRNTPNPRTICLKKKKKVVLAYKSDQEQRFTKLLRVVVKKETKNLGSQSKHNCRPTMALRALVETEASRSEAWLVLPRM